MEFEEIIEILDGIEEMYKNGSLLNMKPLDVLEALRDEFNEAFDK